MPEGEQNLMTDHVRKSVQFTFTNALLLPLPVHRYLYANIISSHSLYPPGVAVLLDVGVVDLLDVGVVVAISIVIGVPSFLPAEFTATTLMV